MSFHLQAQAPTDADRGIQNGGQINEKSRDFSANARETSYPIRIQGSRTINSILLESKNASTVVTFFIA